MYFNQEEFGKRIRELRMQKGMTQEELALQLHVTTEYVSKLERGKGGCSIDTLLNLSAFFRRSTDYLLTGKAGIEPEVRDRISMLADDISSLVRELDDELN